MISTTERVGLCLVAELSDSARPLKPAEEQTLLATLRNSPFPAAVLDDDRRVVEINDASLQLLGRSREEFVGRRVEELTPPEFAERTISEFEEMLENGQVAAASYALDGDERIVKVERFMVANIVPGRHLSISFDPTALAAIETDAAQTGISVVVASDDSLTAEISTMVINGEAQFDVVASSDLARLGAVILGHRPQVAVIVQSPFRALSSTPDGPDVAGIVEELSGFLGANSLDTYTLVINDVNRPDLARDALMAGATGVFCPQAGMTEMFKAIEEVSRGRSYVSPSLTRQVFSDDGEGLGSLTPRERQVLKRIALGYTNQECADELFLSVRTIEKHHANIKKRIGAQSRREIVSYALKHNVLFSAVAWMASAIAFV